jgi:hypothetical protein
LVTQNTGPFSLSEPEKAGQRIAFASLNHGTTGAIGAIGITGTTGAIGITGATGGLSASAEREYACIAGIGT